MYCYRIKDTLHASLEQSQTKFELCRVIISYKLIKNVLFLADNGKKLCVGITQNVGRELSSLLKPESRLHHLRKTENLTTFTMK